METWETFEHDRMPLSLRQQLGEPAGGFVDHGVNALAAEAGGSGSRAPWPCPACASLRPCPRGPRSPRCAERYERRCITSNLVFSQWEHIFANPMATAAAIDRVMQHPAPVTQATGPEWPSSGGRIRR